MTLALRRSGYANTAHGRGIVAFFLAPFYRLQWHVHAYGTVLVIAVLSVLSFVGLALHYRLHRLAWQVRHRLDSLICLTPSIHHDRPF